MRRLFALLALLALGAFAAGCSGRDAEEARALLTESQTAVQQLRSMSFTAKVWTSGAPQNLSVTMSGGAYAKGKHKGDFYVLMSSDGLGVGEMVVIRRDGHMSASADGAVIANPLPAPAKTEWSVGMLELDPYVKDVKVEHDKLIGSERTVKVTGVLDTEAFVKGSLGGLPQMAALGDAGLDIAEAFGDVRAVYYLSETSHLPVRALADLPMHILGEDIVLHVDFAYTSFNKTLRFPGLH